MSHRVKRAVVTAAYGPEAESALKVAGSFSRSYAERCDADYVLLKQQRFAASVPKTYEKLQLSDLLAAYDRILYVDVDVLILPGAPDVFSLFPARAVAVCDVFESRNDFSSEIALAQRELGDIGWSRGYFNAGVMLVSERHREMFDPPAEKLAHWMKGEFRRSGHAFRDQTILNYECRRLEFPLVDMGFKFNHTRAWGCSERRFRSHFLHYAGNVGLRKRGSRLRQMRLDAFVARRPRLLTLMQRHPRLVDLTDHL